jgi:hypothetical protein
MAAKRSDAFIAVGAAASAARVLRKDFTSRITARVGSAALRRGMHSGNRAWFYVAAGATGLRLFHRYLGRKEDVVAIRLRPGESISIREIVRTK